MDSIGGYDCSGLAIASICEVMGIATSQWPSRLRHTQQLACLGDNHDAEPGDIRLYTSGDARIHLGIATTEEEAIHASGISKLVEEGEVIAIGGSFTSIRRISVDCLLSNLG